MNWDDRVTGEPRGLGVGIKQTVLILGSVFAVTLAVVVAKQMSSEAMAVVVGVVCGVAAGIPTSMLLLVVLTRRDNRRMAEGQQMRQGSYPPVVVVQGGGGMQGLPSGPQAGYWPSPMPGPVAERQFQVVGGDDFFIDERGY
jgi:hypothetical protein